MDQVEKKVDNDSKNKNNPILNKMIKRREIIIETDGSNIYLKKLDCTPLEAHSIFHTLYQNFGCGIK